MNAPSPMASRRSSISDKGDQRTSAEFPSVLIDRQISINMDGQSELGRQLVRRVLVAHPQVRGDLLESLGQRRQCTGLDRPPYGIPQHRPLASIP